MRSSQWRLTAEPAPPESLVSTNWAEGRRLCDPGANPPGVLVGRSYRPARYPVINSLLGGLDRLTHGRVDSLGRLAIYVCIGGCAGAVNLTAFAALFHVLPAAFGTTGAPPQMRWLLVFIGATEISMVPNFLANDYITFRHFAGHRRAWWERCLRFHLTCAMGSVLTLLISGTLYTLAVPPTIAQAIGIIVVTAFNFTLHHAFTYRFPHATAQDPRERDSRTQDHARER